MERELKICPCCGKEKLEYKNRRHWVCPDCGFDLYNNVAAAAGIIFYLDEESVIFAKRAKEPKKGMLDLPGGFTDPDETMEETCIRECMEETGITISPEKLEYVANFPNTYNYKGIEYKTCDFFFAYHLDRRVFEEFMAQKEEVSDFVEMKVSTEEDVDKLPLAFVSGRAALKAYVKKRNAARNAR
ncbi:MAG: NUDIX domain-containing protein [Treponemataceae bacterium]|nr:NUDIX domain-containing protein [Treponemataceae bacterium]